MYTLNKMIIRQLLKRLGPEISGKGGWEVNIGLHNCFNVLKYLSDKRDLHIQILKFNSRLSHGSLQLRPFPWLSEQHHLPWTFPGYQNL